MTEHDLMSPFYSFREIIYVIAGEGLKSLVISISCMIFFGGGLAHFSVKPSVMRY